MPVSATKMETKLAIVVLMGLTFGMENVWNASSLGASSVTMKENVFHVWTVIL